MTVTNEYYEAPVDQLPLVTIRSKEWNSNNAALQAAFDAVPEIEDSFRDQYGIDNSTLATLYELTVDTLSGAYFEGMQVWFVAQFSSTGPASVSVNGGTNVTIVNGLGDTLVADEIRAGQVISILKLPGAESTGFQVTTTVLTQQDISAAVTAAAEASDSADAAAASAAELQGNRALSYFLGTG